MNRREKFITVRRSTLSLILMTLRGNGISPQCSDSYNPHIYRLFSLFVCFLFLSFFSLCILCAHVFACIRKKTMAVGGCNDRIVEVFSCRNKRQVKQTPCTFIKHVMIKWFQMQVCAAEWNEIINISNLTTNTFVWCQRVGWCVDWNCSHECVHSCVSAWINLYLHASSRFGRNSWSTYWRFWIWGKVLWRYQGKSPAPHLSTGSLRSWRVPEDLNLQCDCYSVIN